MTVNVAIAPTINNMPVVVLSALSGCGERALPGIAINQIQSLTIPPGAGQASNSAYGVTRRRILVQMCFRLPDLTCQAFYDVTA